MGRKPVENPKKPLSEASGYDPLMRTDAAAEYLSIDPSALRRMARMREIAVVKKTGTGTGHPIRFRLSALNAWAARNEQKPLRGSG